MVRNMDLDLQGNIERFTLPEIFQLVSSGRKTGTLGLLPQAFVDTLAGIDANVKLQNIAQI